MQNIKLKRTHVDPVVLLRILGVVLLGFIMYFPYQEAFATVSVCEWHDVDGNAGNGAELVCMSVSCQESPWAHNYSVNYGLTVNGSAVNYASYCAFNPAPGSYFNQTPGARSAWMQCTVAGTGYSKTLSETCYVKPGSTSADVTGPTTVDIDDVATAVYTFEGGYPDPLDVSWDFNFDLGTVGSPNLVNDLSGIRSGFVSQPLGTAACPSSTACEFYEYYPTCPAGSFEPKCYVDAGGQKYCWSYRDTVWKSIGSCGISCGSYSLFGNTTQRIGMSGMPGSTASDVLNVTVNGCSAVAPPPPASCTGSIPPNGVMHTGETIANLAWQYSSSNTARACEFKCATNYNWNGSACVIPDLTSGAVSLNSGTPDQGQSVTFRSTVTNSGSGPTLTGFYNNFTYRWGTSGAWTEFTEVHHNTPLGVGVTRTDTSSNFTLTQNGTLQIQHCVDSRNQITDANGANDCRTQSFTVNAAPLATLNVEFFVSGGNPGNIRTIGSSGINCPSDCSEGGYTTYPTPATPRIRASENFGFNFLQWSGCSTSNSNAITVTMNGNKTCTANYARCTGSIPANATAQVTGNILTDTDWSHAAPQCGFTCDSGYLYKPSTNECVLAAALTVVANDNNNSGTVTGPLGPGNTSGTGGIDCGSAPGSNDCSETYYQGLTVTLRATNDGVFDPSVPTYYPVVWGSGCTASGNPEGPFASPSTYNITMGSNKNCEVTFVGDPVLDVTPGTVPSGDTIDLTWETGGSLSCTLSADRTGVWVNGSDIGDSPMTVTSDGGENGIQIIQTTTFTIDCGGFTNSRTVYTTPIYIET